MKTPLLAGLLAALAFGSGPVLADEFGAGTRVAGAATFVGVDLADAEFDRRGRGRGRGRGGEDRAGDDRDGGHGGRPRVPGGSGCDDPGDIAEHPECRV